ncbi:hypothetical protein THICB3510057 [Thiomonas sp. CB3]|nr:hypothetical protein THICB3510057 [Thiomonas sp. CB3]
MLWLDAWHLPLPQLCQRPEVPQGARETIPPRPG